MLSAVVALWLLSGLPQQSGEFVSTSEAAAHVGKTKTVCGTVAAVRHTGPGNRRTHLLDLDRAYPKQSVTIVVSVDAAPSPSPTFEDLPADVIACATNKVEQKDDGLQIKVAELRQLRGVAPPPTVPAEVFFGVPPAGQLGIVPPRLLRQVNSKYTSNAMRATVSGLVELEGVVRTDGTIGPVRVKRSLDALYGLDAAAIDAFPEWRLQPATRNGQPLEVVVSAELEFRLR